MKYISTYALMLLLTALAGVLGYYYFYGEKPTELTLEPTPTPQASTTPEPFAAVTTEEKIAQLIATPITLSATGEVEWYTNQPVGTAIIFGSNVSLEEAQLMTQATKTQNTATFGPPLIAVDHEGGTVQRLAGEGFTKLPSWRELCALEEGERLELLDQSIAEVKSAGVHIVFAPVVDVATNNPVLGNRVCSGDYTKVTANSLGLIEEYQQEGILTVLKHYPGLGTVEVDTHTSSASAEVSSREVAVYDQILKKYPQTGVMTAHVSIKNQLSVDLPCSINAECILALQELHPYSLVFTDALEMGALTSRENSQAVDLSGVALQALLAGNDVLVFGATVSPEQIEQVITVLAEEYQTNTEFKSRVDEALEKFYTYKQVLNS